MDDINASVCRGGSEAPGHLLEAERLKKRLQKMREEAIKKLIIPELKLNRLRF